MVSNVQHQRIKKKGKKKFNEATLMILSHNTRGLARAEHIEECINWTEERKAWATCLQETWILKNTIYEHNNSTIINHGPPEKLCRRGSLGVAIVLNQDARKAWEAAGSQRLYFGIRILAIRLKINSDDKRKSTTIFLVSAYAPTPSKTHM